MRLFTIARNSSTRSAAADAFFSTGAIAIMVGAHVYEVEFRGDHKSHHVHNVIFHQISS